VIEVDDLFYQCSSAGAALSSVLWDRYGRSPWLREIWRRLDLRRSITEVVARSMTPGITSASGRQHEGYVCFMEEDQKDEGIDIKFPVDAMEQNCFSFLLRGYLRQHQYYDRLCQMFPCRHLLDDQRLQRGGISVSSSLSNLKDPTTDHKAARQLQGQKRFIDECGHAWRQAFIPPP
jgi:hypothetical protein